MKDKYRYVAYGYDDSCDAPIMCSASSLEEAIEDAKDAKQGWIWYRYEFIKKQKNGNPLYDKEEYIGCLDEKI
jgi:hypothetical protein